MAEGQPALYAFNRGLISPLALARQDVKRTALSAEVMTNWMPRVLGSMMLRPGLQYVLNTLNNLRARYLPFIYSTTDVSFIELTNLQLRIINPGSDGVLSEPLARPSVSTVVVNGTFSGSLFGWTNSDQAGAVSQWSGGLMALTGTGFNSAIESQQIYLAAGDIGVEHGVRIVVNAGPVVLNIGTSAGDGTYAMNLNLGAGTHSIAFTPTGNFFIQFSSAYNMTSYVTSVQIEAIGAVILPTPWADINLQKVRIEQSGGVIYAACYGLQQQKIIRWGPAGAAGGRSWSIALYQPLDGPFKLINATPTTLAASFPNGQITLTASAPLFQAGHVGALFKIASQGFQTVTVNAAGTHQWSSAVEVTGAGQSGRTLAISVTGTFSATVVLQQSIGVIGNWIDVGTVAPSTPGIPTTASWVAVGNVSSWTSPIAGNVYDGFDNSTIFYRIGIESSYSSGVAVCTLNHGSGTITGVVRIISVINTENATAQVIEVPGNTGVLTGLGAGGLPTNAWYEGQWSDAQGWPSSVALYEGRMCFMGKGSFNASVSDAYESFDDTVVGDSGPINQNVGSGPVDDVNFLLPLADLVAGGQGEEMTIRSSILGGLLTPTTFNLKPCSTLGSAAIPGIRVDYNGYFLQRSQRRVYKLTYTPSFFLMDYTSSDMTVFCPDIAVAELGVALGAPGFNWMALQRQPDTRIHCLVNDGTVRVLIEDPDENEQAWIKVLVAPTLARGGIVEDVIVLPGQGDQISEDEVYYVVNRVIDGQTVRYLEKWAREEECWGAAVTKCVDSFVAGTNTPASNVISLPNLIGEQIVVWADGIDQGGPFTVAADGSVTLPNPVSQWCGGLAYTAQFQSAKLAYATQTGTGLTRKKQIKSLGLVMQNVHWQGIQVGRDFNSLENIPQVYKGAVTPTDTVYVSYDDAEFPFGGAWDTDARLCLQAASPRPCTVLAAVLDLETS